MTIKSTDADVEDAELLPYNIIVEAVNENPVALEIVLETYRGYMWVLSEGNDVIFERLLIKLLLAIPKFKPKG